MEKLKDGKNPIEEVEESGDLISILSARRLDMS
jgi:hypothetical protein